MCIKKIDEIYKKIKQNNIKLWEEMLNLPEGELPKQIPTDCLIIVSQNTYKELINKIDGNMPNFIQASNIVEDYKMIFVRKNINEQR